MKKYQILNGKLLLIFMLLTLTSCGTNDVKEEKNAITTTAPVDDTSIENESLEDNQTENITTENKQKYEELISKFDTVPIEERNIPCVGSQYPFQVSDTIVNIESLGCNYNAEYLLIYYKNAKNDLIIRDYSTENPEYNYEIDMKIQEKFTEINQINPYYAAIRPSDKLSEIPEIGNIYIAEKMSTITEITDTSVIFEDMHYYEIKNKDGLSNIIYVPTGHILPESYEPYNIGYVEELENGYVYKNSFYGFSKEFDENGADISIYSRYSDSGPCIITTESLSYFGSIITYELFDKVNFNETEIIDFLSEHFMSTTEKFTEGVETFELGNKTYQKKIIEEHYTSEDINTGIKTDNVSTSALLYRYEENKIYTIHIYLEPDVNLLIPFTE